MFLHWLAGAFTLLGVYTIGNKSKWGFIFALISNILWITYVLICWHTFGILLECVPLLIINTRNFIKWYRHDKKNTTTN